MKAFFHYGRDSNPTSRFLSESTVHILELRKQYQYVMRLHRLLTEKSFRSFPAGRLFCIIPILCRHLCIKICTEGVCSFFLVCEHKIEIVRFWWICSCI